MKTRNLLLVFAFVVSMSANLYAQVTIGSTSEPKAGAILDLNSGVPGGLVLSNVEIEHLSLIPYKPNWFPGINESNCDTNPYFTGALVYHTGGHGIPAGIYVWNGTNWTSPEDNCTEITENDIQITYTEPLLSIKSGDAVTFSVSSGASDRCAKDETYTWSVTPGNVGTDYTISELKAATTLITFNTANTYTVQVVVTSPYSPAPILKTVDVTVTDDGGIPETKRSYDYGIVGETCLDVMNTGTPTDRENSFKDSYEIEYKFLHKAAYSKLELKYFDDPSKQIIDDITPLAASADGNSTDGITEDGYYAKTFKVKFKSDVKSLVAANGGPLTVKLVASYTVNGASKLSYLEIRVEDGTCVCPAKISDTAWKDFMCHNMGAKYDIISRYQLITRDHHGDWYRGGAKTASMKNISTKDNSQNWDNTDYQNDNNLWTVTNDPCPTGWSLTRDTQWQGVINNNPQSNVGTYSTSTDKTNFSAAKKFGDYLILPAAGYRSGASNVLEAGVLRGRGEVGFYWTRDGTLNTTHGGYYMSFSSSSSSSNSFNNNYRTYGYSVRCVK